jgi:hypothetical protein
MSIATEPTAETTVLHVGGMLFASEKAVVERALGRRPGAALLKGPAGRAELTVNLP